MVFGIILFRTFKIPFDSPPGRRSLKNNVNYPTKAKSKRSFKLAGEFFAALWARRAFIEIIGQGRRFLSRLQDFPVDVHVNGF